MKKKLLFLLLSVFNVMILNAQGTFKLSFEKSHDTLRRKETDFVYPITLKLDSLKVDKDSLPLYTITVKANDDKSTMAKSSYTLNFNSITLDKVSSNYTFFLTLKKDSAIDRDRLIYLFIEITKKSQKVGANISEVNQTYSLITQI